MRIRPPYALLPPEATPNLCSTITRARSQPEKEQGRGTDSCREPAPPPCLSRHARCRIQLAESCRPRRLSQDACFGGSRFALSYGRDSPTAESDRGSRRPRQKSPIQPDPRRVDRSRTAFRLQGKPCAEGRAPESTPYRQEWCPPCCFASSSCRKLAAPRNTVAAWSQSPIVANTFVFTGRSRRAPGLTTSPGFPMGSLRPNVI